MTVYGVPASLLHQIEQELDAEEKEAMVFLCRDLVPDLPGTDVRKLLVALKEREMLTPFSLAELLYRLKRFDLLKKILPLGRAAVEANLARHPPMVSKYRVLMTEISEELDKEDLRSLVFLLMNDLGASHVKKTEEKEDYELRIRILRCIQLAVDPSMQTPCRHRFLSCLLLTLQWAMRSPRLSPLLRVWPRRPPPRPVAHIEPKPLIPLPKKPAGSLEMSLVIDAESASDEDIQDHEDIQDRQFPILAPAHGSFVNTECAQD
ncbi:hypothetical protein JD844_023170 [Phrynosoma platyrhinos]|uniref:DED domain-containing protein n=1 Tax=Phrynosoma platyrhinos TaxID=52577 RepID=A0ABQ7SW28_PHRPL|nr:hypothetical protein JD844_023170 [Phrynosoma platyrhinos]